MQCLQFKTIKCLQSVLLYSSTYSSIPPSPPDGKMSPLGNTPAHKISTPGHNDKKTMGWKFPPKCFLERILNLQCFETYADICPLLQLCHGGIQLAAPLLLTVNLKRSSIAIFLKSFHLAGQFRSVHAVLCLLPVRVDLALQGRLDRQELGAHRLGIALSSFCLPLPAAWRTTNHRVPALAWTS